MRENLVEDEEEIYQNIPPRRKSETKMRENLVEDEEEIYQNIPPTKKGETIYAKLLKPKSSLSSMTKEERSALNINDDLLGYDSDFNRKDDFPSLQTKGKKRVMIAPDNDPTPERDTKHHPPDQGDNQSLISFGGSSVFDQNPVSYLIYKLNKIHKKAENVIFQHSSEQKLLEMISKELSSSLEKYEEEGRKLKSVSPAEQEEIETLLNSLEEDQFKAGLSLSKISQKNENKKNAARPSFPVFDGSPLSFLNWQHEIDCAMEHLEDPQKRSTYKKCISGVNKDFILTHLTNCTTYEKMKSAMFNMFGHVDSLLPKLISEMRDLPSTPSNSYDENKNINSILAFMRWLESHNKESVFSSDLIISARKKLRQFTQDLYYQHKCTTFTDFKLYLENLQENNFERLQSEEGKKGLPGVGAKVAGLQPRRPCLLCSQDHRESNCHMIKSLTSDSQVKDLLRKNNLCFICLEKFGKNHNCSKTWRNKAGHIQQKSCQKCKNGLNYFVCPHVRGPRQNTPVTGQGPGAGASGGQSSVGGASGGQGSLPSASSGTQVYSNAKACSMDQNIVKIFFTKIIVNGTQFGKTQCCSQIVKVVSRNGAMVDIHVLWDRGAEHSVCSLELQEFFWDAPPLNFSLSQVSTCQEVRGKLATLCLLTNDGNTLNIQALAQPLTARHVESKCLPVPETWQKLHSLPENYIGPSGAYTLILGQDVNDIFPVEIDRYDKLSLFRSCINNQLIVAGSITEELPRVAQPGYGQPGHGPLHVPVISSHKAHVSCTVGQNSEFYQYQLSKYPIVQCHSARISPSDTAWLDRMCPPDFAILPKVCQDCINHKCLNCKSKLMLSPKQRYEEEMLTKSISFVEDPKPNGAFGHFEISACYNSELKHVPNLYEETKRFQLKLEDKLLKFPAICDGFNEQIFKRIRNNNFSFIEDVKKMHPEFDTYQQVHSPCNYSLKMESVNTPVRPCVNQGFAPYNLPSLNSTMFTGPSLNLPIQQITLKMRSLLNFGISDINNFYQSCFLSPRDKALNMMLFRENGWGKPGEIKQLVSNRLTYGSRHAQFLANKCKIIASEKYILPFSPKAHELLLCSMTDDVFVGAFKREEMFQLSEIMTNGLLKTNFILKEWVYSGITDNEISMGVPNMDKDESHGTLGLSWFSKDDYWLIKPNICLAPRKRGARDMNFMINNMQQARELFAKYGVSRRTALRLCHGFYDPINLFVQLKNNKHLLYRKLIRLCPDLPWDNLIPESLHQEWLDVIAMTLDCSQIRVPRFCMTDCIDLNAQIGLYCDGGIESACCRIFIRYKNKHGTYSSNYLTGSTKLAPPGAECAPKTECESALMALRLAQTIKQTFTDINITDFYLFSDSTITLGGLTGLTCTQKLFYSLRNYESSRIVSELGVQLFLVQSGDQEADIGSKLDLKTNFAKEKTYWTGKWFFKNQNEWPCKPYIHDVSHITFIQNPKMTLNIFSLTFSISLLTPLMQKYKSFDRIVSVLAYIFCFLKSVETFSSGWGKALRFILNTLKISKEELSGVSRQYLVQKDENGLYVASPRNFMMKGQIIREKLFIISSHEKVSEMIIYDSHIHCSNIGQEIALMYSKGFMVLKATKLFRKLSMSCLTCRRIRQACSPQLMGASHQLNTALLLPLFAVSYMDVMGYFKLKISKNVVGKIWILVLSDLKTRFTKFIPLQSMTADSVLMAIKTASYQLAGSLPYLIFSDSASNFIPISQLETDIPDTTQQKKLVSDLRKVLQSQKITLKTNCPRASWRNSAAESMVRVYKNCLKKCGLDHKTFTLQQWVYVSSKIEYLCNNRCLSVKYLDQTLTPLRPCDLVFGSRKNIFPRDFTLHENDSRLFSSLITLDKQIAAFENIYFTTYCLELKRWTKFKTRGKEINEGDICWMLDRINKSTKMPTLCAVTKKHSERTFSVEYTKTEAKIDCNTYEIIKTGKKSVVQRPSQQLCYITSTEGETNTDPFTPHDDDLEEHLLPFKPPEKDSENQNDETLIQDELTSETLDEELSPKVLTETLTPEILPIKTRNDSFINDSLINDSNDFIEDDTPNDLIPNEVSNDLSIESGSLSPVKLKVQYDQDSDIGDIVDIVKLVKPPPKKKRPKRKRK